MPTLIPQTTLTPPSHFAPLSDAGVATLLRRPGAVHLDDEVLLARQFHAQAFNLLKLSGKELELTEEVATRLDQMNFLLKSALVCLAAYVDRQEKRFREAPKEQGPPLVDHVSPHRVVLLPGTSAPGCLARTRSSPM